MTTIESKTRWSRRTSLGLGLIALLLAAGASAEHVASRAEAERIRPPGRLVDVGGHELHIHATGSGGPTIVLEAGASCHYGVWSWIQPELSKQARVISYDRAGLGFSQPTQGARDAASVARELHLLLTRAGEAGPYLLVAHSYGALFASEFAQLYPRETAGIVLIDGTHPDQVDRSRELARSMALFRQMFHLGAIAARFGLMRFTHLLSDMAEGLPPEQIEVAKSLYASPQHLEASARELDAWRESAQQVSQVRFGDFPKLFLSASGPDTQQVRDLQALHQALAAQYPPTEHRILPGTSHIPLVTHRDQATAVTNAILETLVAARAAASSRGTRAGESP